ncbi:MBG domain-containing protein, partial [Pedobacter sp. MC2016-24]|uniref:MBG domain-containing protein n=1 Tax=Pedobacter sp. MC2016-24 TaxID=2780090 RepID=UPI0019FA8065
MKKNYFLLIILMFLVGTLRAQTSTEVFETESHSSTSFTDNGVIFNILSHNTTFDIQANFPGTGWSGTTADNRYIDNTGTALIASPSFSIKTTSNLFKVNRFWVFLSTNALNQNVAGTLTITGKLNGITKFTQTKTTGFATSLGVTNGFTLIDMTNLNGQNYSNIIIDQLQITAGGAYQYIGLDAFTWVKDSGLVLNDCVTITPSQTNLTCNGAANGTATVAVTGGVAPYTYSWTGGAGTAATATGLNAGNYTVTVSDAASCVKTQTFTITQPAILSATALQTNIACNGSQTGSIALTPTGGTAPYTYTWSPGGQTTSSLSNLGAGTYSVVIKDANLCQTTQTYTITQPIAITGTTSSVPVSCFGGSNGSASVTASGGAGGFYYSWSPSGGTAATATGLQQGNYTVTVTDNYGCSKQFPVTVGGPSAALSVTPSQTNVLCNGTATGTATVNVTGGTPGYTYVWLPSGGTAATATGLAIGNYSCLITDAKGCTTSQNFAITQPAALVASTAQINATCTIGGQASVTPSGGTAPYTYLWSPGGATTQSVTGLAAGSYSVIITDANGCNITKNFSITSTNTLVATTATTSVLCNGSSTGTASVTPSGAPGPYTYLWSTGASTASVTGLAAGNYNVTITSSNGCSIVKNISISQPAPFVVTPTQTNVSCNGGSNGTAKVTVSGGSGPYTYAWAPRGGTAATATGLAAGTYTVTITDENLCQATQSFTITEPTAITATTTSTGVSCFGGSNGSASVTATGGTGAYTYAWSPSGGTAATATGLTAGTYTVYITDANTCVGIATVVVGGPSAPLSVTPSQTNVACNGTATGSATVSVTGGTPGYTYSWSPSGGTAATATGLFAGNYICTITDANGCIKTQNFAITQSAPLVATTSQTNVTCNGSNNGTATVSPSGIPGPYTYSWAPSGGTAATATGLAAGTYNVTITAASGCSIVKTITISQPAALAVTPTQTNVSCNGGTNGTAKVTVTGGSGPYSYSWAPRGGTAATATGLAAGTYTVTITDANLCQATQSFTITEPTAITATTTSTGVSCFGGSNGSASVTATGGTGTYTYAWSPSGGTAATATGLTAGTYTVYITDANTCVGTATVVVGGPSAPLSVTPSQTNVLCNGTATGSATVSVTGGTPGYTYSWSPSGGTAATATGLIAGNYVCTITDANGCIKTQNFAITQSAPLVATTSQTNVLCNGSNTGTATVSPSGIPGPYTYSWAPSGGTAATATGLAAGTYNVTITAASGCSIVKTITITQPAAFAVTPSQTNVACNGSATGSASVAVSGGFGPYTYSWSPAGGTAATATGLVAGTYVVTIKDANLCQTTQSFTITEPTAITASTTQTNVSTALGANGSATVTATGGTGTYSYVWSPTGGTAATATGLASGNYTVTVTDANGCNVLKNVTILEPASISGFTAISKTYGDANFNITAPNSNSTGAFTYTSSDPTVASVSGNAVTLIKSGTTTITATQAASGKYAQTTASTTLTVAAKQLTIANTNRAKVYGQVLTGTDFAGTITGLVNGDNITVTRTSTGAVATAGVTTYPIVATVVDPGNKIGNYTVSNPNGTLTVTAKALTITADDKEKFAGTANPTLTVSYAGFANNETAAVLTTPAVIATTATLNSVPGDYPITASGAVAANYSISYVAGNLKVKPGAPTDISLAAVTLYENAAAGANAGTLSSTSPDASATFTYTLVAGAGDTDNASFAISGNRINTTAVLDYETKAVYSVRVRTTTQYGLFLDKVISINLTDVNEIPTLAAIANQTICYNRTVQNVALTGISAGPEASQTTTLSVSS